MKSRLFWWMCAGITSLLAVALSLTSCSEEYNNQTEPKPSVIEQVLGNWYVEYEQSGTIPGWGEEDDVRPYFKRVQYYHLETGAKGLWTEFYLDEMGTPMMQEGGLNYNQTDGEFNYITRRDGTLEIKLINASNEEVAISKILKLNSDGELKGTDGETIYALQHASEELDAKVKRWDDNFHGGNIFGDSKYNVNADASVMEEGVFDYTNWHQHTYILTRVTENVNTSIKDKYDRIGYRAIMLPWAKDASGNNMTVPSNLPAGFCDDLTPENGWDLVANFCGRYDYVAANFIALYNKWTGVLRYFYYIPEDAKINGAADHNWEILMDDGTAEHSTFRYAVPMDIKIKNPDKINVKNAGFWYQFVTPWNATNEKFGQQSPQSGWYAFDVDLSVYRGSGKSMQKDHYIKPMIRGYKTSNADLFTNIDAEISGNIQLEKSCVNSSNGVFGPLEDMLGQVKGVKKFIGNAKNVYGKIKSGDIVEAYEGGLSLAKEGADLVGIAYGQQNEGINGYKGTVNLRLNNDIDFRAKINESNVIQGPTNFTQSIDEFDFKNTLLGEGVWNLETSPVVYYTNAMVQWRYEYDLTNSGETSYVYWTDRKSPFGAQKELAYNTGVGKTSKDPWCGYVNYFDPSSVKVVLNPKLFTAEEIASAQVYAICGVRKSNSAYGSLDDYRSALGLTGSQLDIAHVGGEYVNRRPLEAGFDALAGFDDKMGLETGKTFPATKFDGHNCGMFGRGDADYILEPVSLSGDDHDLRTYMPSYEVTVTVMVNHDGKPLVYTRTYLPEYRMMEAGAIPFMTAGEIEQTKPDHYAASIFTSQMERINELHKWTFRTLQAGRVGTGIYGKRSSTNMVWDKPAEAFPNLFDGWLDSKMCSSKWCAMQPLSGHTEEEYTTSIGDGSSYAWVAEFNSNFGINPTGFTLYTTSDAGMHSDRNPKEIYLLGKKYKDGLWSVIFHTDDAGLPKGNSQSKSFSFDASLAKDMQYFRLEVLGCSKTDDSQAMMQLAEFEFNYSD